MLKKLRRWLSKQLWSLLSEIGATNFPGSLDSYSTKNAGDTIAEGHMNDVQDAIEALEAKVGAGASTPINARVLAGNAVGASAWEQVNLADAVTGTLPVANGGTGLTTAIAKTGTYTGDGNATQEINGVPFRPKILLIFGHGGTGARWFIKTDQDGTYAAMDSTSTDVIYQEDHIISLDADGFTVGDGTAGVGNIMNINTRVYTYIAWTF